MSSQEKLIGYILEPGHSRFNNKTISHPPSIWEEDPETKKRPEDKDQV